MSLDGIEVGTARPEEYAALGAATVAGYLSVDPGLRAEYLAEVADIGARVATPGRIVLAVRAGGRPAGSATVVLHSALEQEQLPADAALLRMFAIDPAFHGRGLGGALLDGTLALAREHGRARMFLYTQPVMRAAHRLYESRGFERVPARDWKVDGGPELLAYELSLER